MAFATSRKRKWNFGRLTVVSHAELRLKSASISLQIIRFLTKTFNYCTVRQLHWYCTVRLESYNNLTNHPISMAKRRSKRKATVLESLLEGGKLRRSKRKMAVREDENKIYGDDYGILPSD